jgi:hypothetical protein
MGISRGGRTLCRQLRAGDDHRLAAGPAANLPPCQLRIDIKHVAGVTMAQVLAASLVGAWTHGRGAMVHRKLAIIGGVAMAGLFRTSSRCGARSTTVRPRHEQISAAASCACCLSGRESVREEFVSSLPSRQWMEQSSAGSECQCRGTALLKTGTLEGAASQVT